MKTDDEIIQISEDVTERSKRVYKKLNWMPKDERECAMMYTRYMMRDFIAKAILDDALCEMEEYKSMKGRR